jgi:hypothetical protein
MAKFIVNSTGDKAVRLANVISLRIKPIRKPDESVNYELSVLLKDIVGHVITFEVGETLEAIQAQAVTILEALEAE